MTAGKPVVIYMMSCRGRQAYRGRPGAAHDHPFGGRIIISVESLAEAIAHPVNGTLSIVVKNFDSVQSRNIRYQGGLRYPHLERIPGSRDFLTEILTARSIGTGH